MIGGNVTSHLRLLDELLAAIHVFGMLARDQLFRMMAHEMTQETRFIRRPLLLLLLLRVSIFTFGRVLDGIYSADDVVTAVVTTTAFVDVLLLADVDVTDATVFEVVDLLDFVLKAGVRLEGGGGGEDLPANVADELGIGRYGFRVPQIQMPADPGKRLLH